MGNIIDGKLVSASVRANVAQEVASLKENGISPSLTPFGVSMPRFKILLPPYLKSSELNMAYSKPSRNKANR